MSFSRHHDEEMNPDNKINIRNPAVTALLVILIALTVFITYGDMLTYFFTSTDSISLISRGRINSLNDVLRIFSEPLGDNLPFYRPISTLSFSLDYFIWELNPFGYHLTDLILHTAVTILVFFLILILTNGYRFIALIGSLLFTTHPILIEVVPAIARRQEILLTLFILLSLIYFLKHLTTSSNKKSCLILSIVFYMLALGVKEVAIIFPIIIFAYLTSFSFSDTRSAIKSIPFSIKKTLPFIMVSFIYLVLHTLILGGIRGYSSNMPTQAPIEIIQHYFLYLFYPVDFINLNIQTDFIIYILLLALLTAFILAVYHKNIIRNFIITSTFGTTLFFLILWLLTPLSIYIFTFTFTQRYMYFSVIPFSIVLSMLIVEAFHAVLRRIKDCGVPGTFHLSVLIKPSALTFVLLSGLAISLVSYSPLIRNYGEWEAQANISNMFFNKLLTIIYKLPNDAEITIYNRPIFFVISDQKYHHVQTAVNLNEYSIKSWLDLMLPDNHFRIIRNGEVITADPLKVGVEIKIEDTNKADVVFTYR